MNKFILEVLFHLTGFGAASGLLFKNDSVLVISDESNAVIEYNIKNSVQNLIPLQPENSINVAITKHLKPDFEAITTFNNEIYIIASGSSKNRNSLIILDNETHAVLSTHDLTDLYTSMQYFSNIDAAEFNIEGLIVTQNESYFFQRGNGKNAHNGIFIVNGDIFSGEYSLTYKKIKLPKTKGVRYGFTDALLIDDTIYFLAAAEKSKSTYADGKILGSILGKINLETLKIEDTQLISTNQKFEGVTIKKLDKHHLEFLLSEDNDSGETTSKIYKLTQEF